MRESEREGERETDEGDSGRERETRADRWCKEDIGTSRIKKISRYEQNKKMGDYDRNRRIERGGRGERDREWVRVRVCERE